MTDPRDSSVQANLLVASGGRSVKVLITGASGLVGSAVASHLTARGARVIPVGRRSVPPFDLAAPVRPELLVGVDAIVHAAWDFRAPRSREESTNIRGTADLLTAARSAGIANTIIVSSMSAAAHVDSRYGAEKRAVEGLADRFEAQVIRPGLVWSETDHRGLVSALRRISALPLVPVPALADARLQLVSACDLAAVIGRLLGRDGADGPLTIAYPEALRIDDIVSRAAALRGRHSRYVRVPVGACMAALAVLETLGGPFTRDNLRGLQGARAAHGVEECPLGVPLRPFRG